MKLSALIQYKKMLLEYNTKPASDHAYNDLYNLLHVIKTSPLQFGTKTQEISERFDQVNQSFVNFNDSVSKMMDEIDAAIAAMEPAYFQESYRLYENDMLPNESTEYILNRRLHQVTQEIYDFITSRVTLYNSHLYPGVILRPSRESFIESMVGCDPLYVMDQSYDLLEPSLEGFEENYRRRVRKVIMKEQSDQIMGDSIPDGQVGFFLVYNFFNFRPFEMIEKWMREIFEKLRPGGVLAMTFNNCDLPNGVMLAERHFMCYTPGRLLENLAESIGYEIRFRYDTHVPNTWLELKKPGTTTSLRGGQSLAKIIEKNQ